MPITFFKNEESGFKTVKETGLDHLFGWWQNIKAHDFDNDGDIDFIVGNLGNNNIFQPNKNRPVDVLYKDFDKNGTVDPIAFAYLKKNYSDTTYISAPVNFGGDLFGQSPLFRSKFNLYKDYANTTQTTLFTDEELDGVEKLTINFDKSIYIENLGGGKFNYKLLPIEAQVAPINGIATLDYNNDGNEDILLVGNDFGNEVFIGRYDAFNGLLLENDGKGDFKTIPTLESGFLVPGDSKSIATVKSNKKNYPYYVVTQNRDSVRVFQKN